MSKAFWHEIWQNDHQPFHKDHINELLVSHYDLIMNGRTHARIFVPLCGRSIDMKFLSDKGHHVTGIELSAIAIKRFFDENQLSYIVGMEHGFEYYESGRIRIYYADYFKWSDTHAQHYDVIYDRAALVALPIKLRQRYVEAMRLRCHPETSMCVITLEYDQSLFEGPPYSVSDSEVHSLYSEYNSVCIYQDQPREVPEQLQGQVTQRCYHIYGLQTEQ